MAHVVGPETVAQVDFCLKLLLSRVQGAPGGGSSAGWVTNLRLERRQLRDALIAFATVVFQTQSCAQLIFSASSASVELLRFFLDSTLDHVDRVVHLIELLLRHEAGVHVLRSESDRLVNFFVAFIRSSSDPRGLHVMLTGAFKVIVSDAVLFEEQSVSLLEVFFSLLRPAECFSWDLYETVVYGLSSSPKIASICSSEVHSL